MALHMGIVFDPGDVRRYVPRFEVDHAQAGHKIDTADQRTERQTRIMLQVFLCDASARLTRVNH